MTKTKHKDLQPWLDYFELLHNYEQRGLLELHADKHECYVTQSALHAMTPGDDPAEQLRNGAIADTLRHLRTYAAYRWAPAVGQQHPVDINDPDAEIPIIPIEELTAYFSHPFALHVVQEEPPHDLLFTMLLTQQRSWRTAWRTREKIEVIDYTSKATNE